MIISAGYNIAGPEVEDALLRHPDVAEAAVVGRPDELRGPDRGGVRRAARGRRAAGDDTAAALPTREAAADTVQVPARDRLPRRASAHPDRQAAALPAAGGAARGL